MTTTSEIRAWLDRGIAEDNTHMLVICDTFDWSYYPIYVTSKEDAVAMAGSYPHDMQVLMEVYDLTRDFDEQLGQRRAYNF